MKYALGLDTDAAFLNFLYQASRQGRPVIPLNIRAFAERGDWHIDLYGPSYLHLDNCRYDLNPDDSFYARVINLGHRSSDKQQRSRWQNLSAGLMAWLQLNGRIVINRPDAGVDNGTKSLHEFGLAELGFAVPESLTSSDRAELQAFSRRSDVIVKTVCGVRANCRDISSQDIKSYQPSMGPLHIQRKISGYDVRVHVVGDFCHAVRIDCDVTDYRIDARGNRYTAEILPEPLEESLVYATHAKNLKIAGWDFKVDKNREFWCLEANPMPGYDQHDRLLNGALTSRMLDTMEP